MKYFKPELWTGIQSDDTFAESAKQWDDNLLAYTKQLEQLGDRLSKRNQNFFNHHSLHDGKMLSFSILNETAKLILENGSYLRTKDYRLPLTIKIEVLADEYLYELTFRKVHAFNINYNGGENVLPPFTNDFGDWGYAELTDAGNDLLSYEILFSSGSVIKMIFKTFSYSRKKFFS